MVAGDVKEKLAGKAKTIGVKAVGRKTEDNIACRNPRAVNDPRTIDDTDNKTGDVVLTIRIKARHLGSFAAEKRTAGIAAATRKTAHDLLDHVRVKFACCDVVKEKERAGALHQNVV